MLCEICGRNHAEKKLNKSINGTLRTVYVCKECFNRGGESAPKKERKCPYKKNVNANKRNANSWLSQMLRSV